MKNLTATSFIHSAKPYLFIAIAAVLAYLPISSMLFTLKNDVLAIEYPIQHFMSESLRNGEFPSWFNTWHMGFPLQSILTWGVYSTPRMLIGWALPSNIYVFHLEFLFYIMASGWCMFKLLKTHFIADRKLALLLSCCYMLSGFTVGSSQWLLYITAMTFVPLLLHCLLRLLKQPSLKYALLFAISVYLLFTNVHIYLSVVSFYLLAAFLLVYCIMVSTRKDPARSKAFKWLAGSCLLAALLCAAPAYYTYELVQHLDRRNSIASELSFFQSNYLHPDALSSLLVPLSSVKTIHPNTEGTVLNAYIGLLPLLLLPVTFIINKNGRNRLSWILLAVAALFLIVSFGHLTPVRGWLNIFPAMSRFRHPGVLRVFFNFFIILYIAHSLRNYNFAALSDRIQPFRKTIIATLLILLLLAIVSLLVHVGGSAIWNVSVRQTLKFITADNLWFIGAFLQIGLLLLLLIAFLKLPRFVPGIILLELVINTLACTPFFTISTYSAKEVNKILASPPGFPVQTIPPAQVASGYTDEQGNTWPNINTFKKQVSTQVSMAGPLILENVSKFLSDDSSQASLAHAGMVVPLPHSDWESSSLPLASKILQLQGVNASIKPREQRPRKVSFDIEAQMPMQLMLLQSDFPGWEASLNGKQLPLIHDKALPFVTIETSNPSGTLEFRYEKKSVQYSALLLHAFIVISLLWCIVLKFRRNQVGVES